VQFRGNPRICFALGILQILELEETVKSVIAINTEAIFEQLYSWEWTRREDRYVLQSDTSKFDHVFRGLRNIVGSFVGKSDYEKRP
jgi:hypothetical protein